MLGSNIVIARRELATDAALGGARVLLGCDLMPLIGQLHLA